MRPMVWIALAGLVFGGFGFALGQTGTPHRADETPAPEAHAHHDSADGVHEEVHGAHDLLPDPQAGWSLSTPPNLTHVPPFSLESGEIPTRDAAKEFANAYGSFTAIGNEGLDELRAEGYLTGDGTRERPYVLDRFYIQKDLTIQSTDRALVLKNGYVDGTLRLNYIGNQVYVHHVYADDLRVNENVDRYGNNTGGLFHDNHFAFVGQIRHFVGEFRDNQVGPRPKTVQQEYLGDTGILWVPPSLVFNFDGFHAADVHHNTFLGFVDIKLHGHNHGDCFTCLEHNHENETGEHAHTDLLGFPTHHSVRYASLTFRDNEIRVDRGLALRYNDRNHAGDDRTAASEPNESLEDDHVHFQDVTIARNRLIGGGFMVDIFNAEDELHTMQNRGLLRVWENDIAVALAERGLVASQNPPLSGITLEETDGLGLDVRGNLIRFAPRDSLLPPSPTARAPELRGITLLDADHGNLTIASNVVETGAYGIWAQDLRDALYWSIVSNDFRTTHAWRGEDVSNPPEEPE